MKITDALLPEFDQEMTNTRKTLERVPDDKLDWKPHPKSFAMGSLATHIVNMLGWTVDTIQKDSFDIAPPGAHRIKRSQSLRTKSCWKSSIKRGGGTGGHRGIERRDSSEAVVAARSRQDVNHHAARRVDTRFCDEPHHPPSRPVGRVLAPQRYCGSGDLRTLG